MNRNLLLTLIVLPLPSQIPDFAPPPGLLGAVVKNDAAGVHRALGDGADPASGNFFGFPPLAVAVMHGNTVMAKSLLDAGARVNGVDAAGNTPLMWAVGLDVAQPDLVEELLRRGADPRMKNKAGEDALSWATRRGDRPSVARLKAAGASGTERIREAVAAAVASLQKSGPQFVKVSGCVSCHHQSLPQMLNGMARKRGAAVDEQAAGQQIKSVVAMFRPIREGLRDGTRTLPNPGITISYALLGLHAEGYAADETTDSMAAAIARAQAPDGSFPILGLRPPMESSHFTATALSLRALSIFGRDSAGSVAQARQWLLRSKPVTTEDKAMRLLGLVWAGENASGAAAELLAAQRADGGWAQMEGMESDAYATGMALVALDAGGIGNMSGIGFLQRTQMADGTWFVRSRANAVQPLRDSGFPHGRHQWISAAGTSWAAMALATALPVEISSN